jgi:predicted GNAT family acetyltransferase
MKVQRHSDPQAFLDRAQPWLMQDEVENNLILSIVGRVATGTHYGAEPPYLATVEEGGQVVACAVRTPPFKPILSRAGLSALKLLLEDITARYETIPAVSGPEPDVRRFAELWSARTGIPHRVGMRQRMFEIRRVLPPENRPAGTLRPAVEEDASILAAWVAAFHEDAHLPEVRDPHAYARERISQKNLFVWEEAAPVSMAAFARGAPNGVRIQLVYTPPEHRRRGYATAAVADLTAKMLAGGCSYCCLVTDLANPTSNHIYQKIGYRSVHDMTDYILSG